MKCLFSVIPILTADWHDPRKMSMPIDGLQREGRKCRCLLLIYEGDGNAWDYTYVGFVFLYRCSGRKWKMLNNVGG